MSLHISNTSHPHSTHMSRTYTNIDSTYVKHHFPVSLHMPKPSMSIDLRMVYGPWSMVHGLKFIYLHIVFTLYVCQTCLHFLQQPASKQTGQIKRPFLLIMTRTMIVMMMMVMMMMVMMITVSRYCSTSLSLSSIIVTSIISSYHIISL